MTTIAQACHWFGERGMPVSKRDIKVRGRWGLVRIRDEWSGGWDDEVDCYDLESGSMFAEPWSGILYSDSPFVPRNQERTAVAMAKINQDYEGERPSNALCLVAVSGDCAAGGMGKTNHVLPIDATHKRIVKKYLEAQLAWHITCVLNPGSTNKSHMNKYHNFEKAGYALRDAGIFQHKYHQRTSWELAFIDELAPRHEPYTIAKATEEDNL